MKKAIKLMCAVLAVFMLLEPISVFAASSTSTYTGKTYTHNSKFDGMQVLNGIDVSYHNGSIDFDKVKAAGIDFVFVRVGYTGYTKSKFSLNYDENYEAYLEDAIAAGLRVGVYWYSQALNTSEAEQEANMVLDVIGDYEITMPVVYDYEFASVSSGRLDSAKLSKAKMTANALAFLDTVSNAGYDGCVYASKNFLENHLNASDISESYKVWLAHYDTTKTSYSGDYDFWQYSSNGKVSGISGRTDVNFWYYSGEEEKLTLPDQTYTGAPLTPEPQVIYNGITLTKDVDYILAYANNTAVGTATVTATGIGAYTNIINLTYTFNIVAPTTKPAKVKGVKLKKRTNTTLTLGWTKNSDAEYYNIYQYNYKAEKYEIVATTNGNVNSYKLTELADGTTHKFKVTAVKGGIEGSRSDPFKTVTSPRKTPNKSCKSSSKKKISFKWKKINCTGYQYQWSTSKNFKKNFLTKTTKKTSVTIKTAKSKKKYYVRVRAYKTDANGKKIYGKWSNVKSVKVK